jgi:hypothetical protein
VNVWGFSGWMVMNIFAKGIGGYMGRVTIEKLRILDEELREARCINVVLAKQALIANKKLEAVQKNIEDYILAEETEILKRKEYATYRPTNY